MNAHIFRGNKPKKIYFTSLGDTPSGQSLHLDQVSPKYIHGFRCYSSIARSINGASFYHYWAEVSVKIAAKHSLGYIYQIYCEKRVVIIKIVAACFILIVELYMVSYTRKMGYLFVGNLHVNNNGRPLL